MKRSSWRALRKLIRFRPDDAGRLNPERREHDGLSSAAPEHSPLPSPDQPPRRARQQILLPIYRPLLRLPAPIAAAAAPIILASTSMTSPMKSLPHILSRRTGRRIALALQGGGAHGAFTWGVLDRLLDEPEIEITAVSGSSAGALNAVALASGLLEDGKAGAQRRLQQLWHRAAGLAELSGLPSTPLERLAPSLGVDWSPGHLLFDIFTRYVSPYQFNPWGIDPLRQLLLDLIDIEALRDAKALPLFIAATRVDSGEMRLFENRDLSIEAILASACLPAINQAIKIDDGYYWDGGFSANPPVLPLISHSLDAAEAASEILLVRVDPVQDDHMPITAGGIRNRLNRLMFNAPLNAELRSLHWLKDQLRHPALAQSSLGQHLAKLRLHSLSADDAMRQFGSASKLRPDLHLVERLHELGRDVADGWLTENAGSQRQGRLVS